MSRRFQDLMLRYAFVRRAIDAERVRPAPSLVRLARLRTLQLKIRQAVHAFIRASAIRRASRPQLLPAGFH